MAFWGVMSQYSLVCDIIGTLFPKKKMTTVEHFLRFYVINIPE